MENRPAVFDGFDDRRHEIEPRFVGTVRVLLRRLMAFAAGTWFPLFIEIPSD